MPAKGQGCTRVRTFSRGESPVSVIGAGIAGAWQALLFAQAGRQVTLHERSDATMLQSTSHWAGGMLAPYCEAEGSEPVIVRLGLRSLDLWREHLPQTPFNGSLVVAHPRDRADFDRFAKMTAGHQRLDAEAVRELEPSLEGRFRDGLFYPDEGHVEPRRVLPQLHARLERSRRHHPLQQRRQSRRHRRHRDRLPRTWPRATPSPNCAASRARW